MLYPSPNPFSTIGRRHSTLLRDPLPSPTSGLTPMLTLPPTLLPGHLGPRLRNPPTPLVLCLLSGFRSPLPPNLMPFHAPISCGPPPLGCRSPSATLVPSEMAPWKKQKNRKPASPPREAPLTDIEIQRMQTILRNNREFQRLGLG